MLLEQEIKKLLGELIVTDIAKIDLEGSSITVKAFDDGNKIFLSTPVYFGGNYIPKSVRNCLRQRAPFELNSMRATLEIDEESFRINLNYIGKLESLQNTLFVTVLEDFSELAAKWRDYLDEHDKNDLIRIPVR